MRKNIKPSGKPDVVMIYQDINTVEHAIDQIKELDINFKTYQFSSNRLHEIALLAPKVVLLSSNNVKQTIRLYIDFLEEYEGHIPAHSSIVLINNRESERAYLACENGLFEDYAIINPLNEPYRLKLALLHALKIIDSHENHSIENLVLEGEDELASCIEHGVNLKKAFQSELNGSRNKLLSPEGLHTLTDEQHKLLREVVGVTFEEMNSNLSVHLNHVLDQLSSLKSKQEKLVNEVEASKAKKINSTSGISKAKDEKLSEGAENKIEANRLKILVAEHSELFGNVLDEMFTETKFEFVIVKDGNDAINIIETFQPDVMLLSYDMPNFTGIEITRLVRKSGNNVPIIAFTHLQDKQLISKWLPYGLSGYIVKPSKKSIILKAVDKAINFPVEVLALKKGTLAVEWIPEYSVGNKELDEQHQMLFKLANDFLAETDKEAIKGIFENIASYTQLHFYTEEELMRQINYPRFEEHVIEHERLLERVNLMKEKLNNYDPDTHHKIGHFLYKWLANHLLKSDMAYKRYAAEIEAGGFDI